MEKLFGLKDTRDWKLEDAKKSVSFFDEKKLRKYAYKPFSKHFIYYDSRLIDRGCSRIGLMQSMFEPNLAIVLRKKVTGFQWGHAFVSDEVVDFNFYNYISVVCPLFLRSNQDELLSLTDTKQVNLSAKALRWCQEYINTDCGKLKQFTEIELAKFFFYYVYAILFSQKYRTRYVEMLKIDFPRIPLSKNSTLLKSLIKIGDDLVSLHLLLSPKLAESKLSYIGTFSDEVGTPCWANETVWISKDKLSGFFGVNEHVWNFQIGDYKVCERWLKDRKGHVLSKHDIEHYKKIIVSISETIRLMAEIDKVIDENGGWPNAFQ
ncbi:MAG: hypothetical protein EBU93_08140 [Chlamydiae bacterium]|nr:hypothetical protein [Chlamydiota bacterium]